MKRDEFQEVVWQQGRALYRSMPWRSHPTFYYVLVSEVMLQQTQVERVRVKFAEFMETFPTLESLATAPLSNVLVVWQGLGYNRRAKFLHEAAKQVVAGGVPTTLEQLIALPGVGKNTAGAILNYVYEQPTAFIETNIRTVYFHHFFADRSEVSDKELLELVVKTIDTESPREWFYALMDYGAYLKKAGLARLDVSKHYKKQSPLSGSVREVRGNIVRILSAGPIVTDELRARAGGDKRYEVALSGLLRDGLVTESGGTIGLTN